MDERSAPPGHLRPRARSGGVEAGAPRPEARPEGLGQVPVEVAEEATIEGALPLDRTSLIGIFSGPDGRTALLRLGTGDVVRAAQGDVVNGAVVTAIADDALRLWQDGQERVLTLPA